MTNSAKVSDHHAIIPTQTMPRTSLAALPDGESRILALIAARLVCAVADKYQFAETNVTLNCGGNEFAAKGKTETAAGWKSIERAFRSSVFGKQEEDKNTVLPPLTAGQSLAAQAMLREGKTTPPKHYTEDTLLSAMETAGVENMPEDAERKGLETPATRAGILEKLVKTALLERVGDKKVRLLLPTQKGVNLIKVAPAEITSPLLTAEWEQRLKQIEHGQLSADEFMRGIGEQTSALVQQYGTAEPSARQELFQAESIGKCSRCGAAVVENKKGFVCSDRSCGFALWKENRFFTAKKKTLTARIAKELLKNGKVKLSGCYSDKTKKTYDATVLLDDKGGKFVDFKLEFDAPKAKKDDK